MPKESSFEYVWWHPLSKYNTLRFEDRNRLLWQGLNIGKYIRNDRFCCTSRPKVVPIHIRKEYLVPVS